MNFKEEKINLSSTKSCGRCQIIYTVSSPGDLGSIFELGKLIQLDAEVKRAELASWVDETEQGSGGGYRGEVHTVAKVVLYLSSRTGRLWFFFFFFFLIIKGH